MLSADALSRSHIFGQSPALRFARWWCSRPEEKWACKRATRWYFLNFIVGALHELTDLRFAPFLVTLQLQDEHGVFVTGAPLLAGPANQPQDGRER